MLKWILNEVGYALNVVQLRARCQHGTEASGSIELSARTAIVGVH
jgi:hypothetical protein